MGYAGQLFFAMRQTNWDVDPPNHDGPGYIKLAPYVKRPKPDDIDANGKRLYKAPDEYADSHDNWVEAEIRRNIDEQTYEMAGLSINVDQPGQPTNPDPRHPTPGSILRDAMQYAGIEVNGSGGAYNKDKYSISIIVGHKQREALRQDSFRYKVVQWVQRLMP